MTKDDNVRVKGVNMDWFQVLAIAGSIYEMFIDLIKEGRSK
jgi:hypothetical protein